MCDHHRHDDTGIPRREFLARSLALGGALLIPAMAEAAQIRELRGSVYVNRRLAGTRTAIRPGDRVTAAYGGRLVFTLGEDAYLVRGGTSLQLDDEDSLVVRGLRLLTGGLLSVFGRGEKRIITRTATIGIRGTGVYLNAGVDRTYFCTCYGETELSAGGHRMRVRAEHHDAHYIDSDAGGTMTMSAAQVIDHTDDELRLLEGLVGRVPAFDRAG